MSNGPCGWSPEPCENCCSDALAGLPDGILPILEQTAAQILWNLTGQRFGLCERVLRPCRKECGSYWGGLPVPVRMGGEWVNLTCGSCVGSCGCNVLSEFVAENVHSVVGVNVDGAELAPEDTVIVYDRRRVVRIDGESWPTCQNLAAPEGAAGTWAVTVLQGEPIPAGGDLMAGILLCELAKACAGDDECRLPNNVQVQSVARQGVTISFADTFESLTKGRTGLFEVDLWLESVNSTANRDATISSIDRPRPSVQTWPFNDGSS